MDANYPIPPSNDGQRLLLGATDDHLWKKKVRKGKKSSPPYVPQTTESQQVKEKLEGQAYTKRYAELQEDVRCMSLCVLYGKYRLEYNSWKRARNPDTRQEGVDFDYVAFGDFRNWLVHLGLRPSRDHSADRINFNKGYEVGNLRWASKEQQAENRKTTKRISWDGDSYTRKGFAKFLGVPYKRLTKQLERGWPLSRIVLTAGKPMDPVADFRLPTPTLEQEYWRRPAKYHVLQRLEWLPRYYQDQSKLAPTRGLRLKFKEMSDTAEWELQQKYAERNALVGAKQIELLEELSRVDPDFDPIPTSPPG